MDVSDDEIDDEEEGGGKLQGFQRCRLMQGAWGGRGAGG
jgi:hypothetical protein